MSEMGYQLVMKEASIKFPEYSEVQGLVSYYGILEAIYRNGLSIESRRTAEIKMKALQVLLDIHLRRKN